MLIHYTNFFAVRNPSIQANEENLIKAKTLALKNILDLFSPLAVNQIRIQQAQYYEVNKYNPPDSVFLDYLSELETDTKFSLTQPIKLRSGSIYIGDCLSGHVRSK